MLHEARGEHDPARAVQLDLHRVRVEEARQLARLGGERVQSGQRGGRHRGVRVLGIHAQAAIGALDEEDLARERRTELRRHREPVLRVEGVIERSVEGQGPCRFALGGALSAGDESNRGGGVGGAPPPRSGCA